MTPATVESRYRFGRYLLDMSRRQVLLGGVPVTLSWRCLDALSLLVEAKGAIIDREVFFQRLWPEIEVEENNLTKVVSQLRRALSTGDPAVEYVETIPRIGYRLGVPVSVEDATEIAGRASTNGASLVRLRYGGRGRFRNWLVPLIAGVVLVVVAATAGVWGWRRYRISVEAEAHYRNGQQLRRLGDPDSARATVESFTLATQINPRNATYFAALAEALGRVSRDDRIDRTAMREAAERAVQLDSDCGNCRAVLGYALFAMFWEWPQAETHLRKAIELSPENTGLRTYMAMYLCTQGRAGEALHHVDEGLRRAPFFTTGHYIRSMVLLFLRRDAEAVSAADRALSVNPQSKGALDVRAMALLQMGREMEALAAWREYGWSNHANALDVRYRAEGMGGALRMLLDLTAEGKVRETNSYRRARWKMYLGDPEGALDELEVAHRFRHFNLMYVPADPIFEPLRNHPRLRRILEHMRLVRVVAGN